MFRTKKQQNQLCRACPVAKVANLMGDSITLLIIRDLLSGPKRFGGLVASLAGVSSRTLTKKLRELEVSGIVEREEFNEKPPRVEYFLTPKGRGLKRIETAMRDYSKRYL